jgi:predicted transcriptional regulator
VSAQAATMSTTAELTSGDQSGTLLPAGTSVEAQPADTALTPARPTIGAINKRAKRRKRCTAKLPSQSRVYKIALATIALKAQGLSYEDIAEQLGTTKNVVITYLKRANSRGWLNIDSFDDPVDKLEIVLKDKVVKNLNKVLDETNEEAAAPTALSHRAVDASLEIAKGTGLLKQHQVVKSDQVASLGVALKVQVEMAPGQTVTQIPADRQHAIGGRPAIDAEIIEAS